VGEAGMWM